MSDAPPLPKVLEDELFAQAEREARAASINDLITKLDEQRVRANEAEALLQAILRSPDVMLYRHDEGWHIGFGRSSTGRLSDSELSAVRRLTSYVTIDPDTLGALL